MYNPKNKQFVFKDSYGKLWNFYFDPSQGICYNTLSRQMSWSEAKVIQAEAYEQFYADMDEKDCFHIVYQDKKGNIIYCLMLQNESVKAIPVLTSKSHASFNKYLSLIVIKNTVHIFFIIEHNGSYMLSYQAITDGIPQAPRKVDNISNLSEPYTVIYDSNNEIYAFYHISDGRNNQIGYKKYSITNKVWSEYSQITTFSVNCINPKVVVDRNGIFHICYQRKVDKQNQLIYQQKIPDRNMWTSETVLAIFSNSIADFSILLVKNSLIIYYIRDNVIYPHTSNDWGSSFSKTLKGNPLSKQYVCVLFKSNSPYEHIMATELPAAFLNGFRPLFINDSSGNESVSSYDEFKNAVSSDISLLKKELHEIKDAQKAIRESISLLRQSLDRTPSPPPAKVEKKEPAKKNISVDNSIYSPEDLRKLFENRKKKKLRLFRKIRGIWKLKKRKG